MRVKDYTFGSLTFIKCCISGYMFFVEYGLGSFNWAPYFIHVWSQVQSFKIYLTEEKASLDNAWQPSIS